MYSRISSACLLAASLAACSVKGGDGEGDSAPAKGEAGEPVGVVALRSVPCALGGAKRFEQDCAIERLERDGKHIVVLRHPDGGFRRLIELDQGKRFTAADGAEIAEIMPNGADIEVTVEDDHYLFPNPARADAPHR